MSRILVTGGAGFLGSHVVDEMIQTHEILVLDDLSSGSLANLDEVQGLKGFTFIRGSIRSKADLARALEGVDSVFHYAAQPDVRVSVASPMLDFEINVLGTLKLLEAMRENEVTRILFASSGGTVYGEEAEMPTPESAALRPISNYGAAKGAVEMYLSSYSRLYGIDVASMRFGNVIGSRSSHGVIHDFYQKLKANPKKLVVLGTGEQDKAYVSVKDATLAASLLFKRRLSGFLAVNVSSGSRLKVSQIAEIVIDELGMDRAEIEYTGTERGWRGDITRTD
ncbi:NAD-dependent epimerase/dehydratase family protein, partial [Candidatus Thorarchaeota archaeon]